jgi:RNA-directed DNA polymerase
MIKAGISLQGRQDKIGIRAKSALDHRFWGLYAHVKMMEVLHIAHRVARAKGGAPGVDGATFHQIEDSGRDAFLSEIKQSLDDAWYSLGRYRKVDFPKGDGTRRTISIPTVRDRVVQGAMRIII